MDRREVLLGMTAMGLAGPLKLLTAQSSEPNSSVSTCEHKYLTLREAVGLRGPVKTCVTDRGSLVDTIEYELGGEPLSIMDNSSDERLQAYERDSQGRLVKHNGTVFSYDNEGRLLGWTHPGFARLEFHYQADGSMISVQTFDPRVIKGMNGAGSYPPYFNWHNAAAGVGVPMGGNVTTIYPRASSTCLTLRATCPPTEVQIRSADGQIVMRTVFTYYDKGRVKVARERNAFCDTTTSTLRNEWGYAIRARTTVKCKPLTQVGSPERSEWHIREDQDTRYGYQYDGYGNWTELTWTTANGSSAYTGRTRRVLTYY